MMKQHHPTGILCVWPICKLGLHKLQRKTSGSSNHMLFNFFSFFFSNCCLEHNIIRVCWTERWHWAVLWTKHVCWAAYLWTVGFTLNFAVTTRIKKAIINVFKVQTFYVFMQTFRGMTSPLSPFPLFHGENEVHEWECRGILEEVWFQM